MHLQDSAFRFRTRERRVNTVNFDVGKNCPKLIGYHSYCENYVSFIIYIMHLQMLKRW